MITVNHDKFDVIRFSVGRTSILQETNATNHVFKHVGVGRPPKVISTKQGGLQIRLSLVSLYVVPVSRRRTPSFRTR